MRTYLTWSVIGALLFASCSSPSEPENDSLQKKPNNASQGAFEQPNKVEGTRIGENDILDLSNQMSIKLTPFVSNELNLPTSGLTLLKNKINSAITQIGIGGEGSNARFIIGPSVTEVSKNITSTAPPKHANTYNITMLVVDVVSETVFNTYTEEIKGVGDSEEKAFLSALRNLDLRNQSFVDFLLSAEDKIIKYYNDNCDAIITEAEAEASMRNFENAYALLSSVPSEAMECFTSVQGKKQEYFKASLNMACNELLLQMKAELGKFNDPSGAGFNPKAMDYYSLIDAQSECYDEAQKEYKKYLAKLNPKAKRDWEEKMKRYNDELEIIRMDKQASIDSLQQAREFEVTKAEIEARKQIDGNQKLLAKYKYDDSPWLIRLFASGSKLIKGEMKTD
jgi:hypothetical protein